MSCSVEDNKNFPTERRDDMYELSKPHKQQNRRPDIDL